MEGLKLRVSLLRSHKLESVPRVVPLILAVHGAIHHDLAPVRMYLCHAVICDERFPAAWMIPYPLI